MRALWRSTLQEPPAKLCQTHRLPISSSSLGLLLSLRSRLWPRFVSNLPWAQQSSAEGIRERRSDNFTRTLIQSLLSNKIAIFLIITASLVSGHSQKSSARNRHNSCIIYDLFLFSFHQQVVQVSGTCTQSSPPAPGSSLPGLSLPALPSHPLPAQLPLCFSGENVIPYRKACLAYRLPWQLKHLPL